MGPVERAFSAPGKALIAGGYLVLYPEYDSYVTALSSRMHALVRGQETEKHIRKITIESSQFAEGIWSYDLDSNIPFGNIKEVHGRRNPFLEATLMCVLAFVDADSRPGFDITIRIFSDPGYHTRDDTTTRVSSNGKRQFLYHKKKINEVAKTGLGSSAGLVSVVTAALLSYFTGNRDVDSLRNTVHNCTQIAHCHAQKKIGSGFDVAAAVYGSIVYRRFQPSLIDEILKHEFHSMQGDSTLALDYKNSLQSIVGSDWHFKIEKCALPPGVRLVMGDVLVGSETPKLVSLVLKWKQENPVEGEKLFESLNKANGSLIAALSLLHELQRANEAAYSATLKDYQVAMKGGAGMAEVNPLRRVSAAIATVRDHLRALTTATGADIEPPSQTALLDRCSRLPGVLGGVVPGAGGFDAICLLVLEDAIPTMLQTTEKDQSFSNVKWLPLHEESDGLLETSPEDYAGL